MKTRKAIYLLISVLFSVFAILQYNDPDFYIWIPIYGWIAILYYFAFKGKYFLFWNALTGLLILAWIVIYIPFIVQYKSSEIESTFGSGEVKSLTVEHMREFLGLILCFLAILYLYFRAKKVQHV